MQSEDSQSAILPTQNSTSDLFRQSQVDLFHDARHVHISKIAIKYLK